MQNSMVLNICQQVLLILSFSMRLRKKKYAVLSAHFNMVLLKAIKCRGSAPSARFPE